MYVSSDFHIRELYYLAASQTWGAADLTALTATHSALPIANQPIVHVTDFAGQGPTARVVYVSQPDHHIRELYYLAASQTWAAADLTALTGAPSLSEVPNMTLYKTDFLGEGPTIRLAYVAKNNDHIVELRYVASTSQWTAVDLNVQANVPS